ncbi:MAG: ParB/RepB/Spo0J family partition protein, partial [Clostridiaceae bacterium]
MDKDNNIKYVPIDLVSANIYQPRKIFDENSLDDLGESIRTYGIIQPISIRKIGNRYEIVAGERRLRAAKKIGLVEVPAIIVDITDKESAAIALLENIQRENLSFLEEAKAYRNLIKEHSYTQDQLSEVIGKKQSTIANKLRILKLDDSVLKIIEENKLTERHARVLLKLPDIEEQKLVLEKVIKNDYNVKATEELVERELLKLSGQEIAIAGKRKVKSIMSPR